MTTALFQKPKAKGTKFTGRWTSSNTSNAEDDEGDEDIDNNNNEGGDDQDDQGEDRMRINTNKASRQRQ